MEVGSSNVVVAASAAAAAPSLLRNVGELMMVDSSRSGAAGIAAASAVVSYLISSTSSCDVAEAHPSSPSSAVDLSEWSGGASSSLSSPPPSKALLSSFSKRRTGWLGNIAHGGGSGGKSLSNSNNKKNNRKAVVVGSASASKESSSGSSTVSLSPKAKSTLLMAVAMACHYLGYSIARPVTISLFTSATTGYADFPGAFPFAMAFISPCSLAILMGYNRLLERSGPKGALNGSTMFCSLVVSLAALGIFGNQGTLFSIPVVKFISGPLFIFRESYVQLLTSQYWSFMASALTPSQSAKWFGPIAGLTSIASAVAGFVVKDIVRTVGLPCSLLTTGLLLLVSLLPANAAYRIAEEHNFSPTRKHGKKQPSNNNDNKNKWKRNNKNNAPEEESQKQQNLFQKATKLFQRVPILKALFVEILVSQGLATILNVAFVSKLSADIPDDAARAGWIGKFFSTINLVTMVIQFGVLPHLLNNVIEPKLLWRIIPFIMLLFTTYQSSLKHPSLYVVSGSLLIMKTLEYSARRTLDEMVFVPLDFESRFLGKEIIGVFGYRFGKSLMSLSLSVMTSIVGGEKMTIQQFSRISTVVSMLWLKTTWSLSSLVPTKKEAEELYNKQGKR